MALRSIPPRTSTGGRRRAPRPTRPIISGAEPYNPRVYKRRTPEVQGKRPRQWSYVTKPFFAKIKEPLVDVFKEAEEVQIIIDLGGFSRDEVNFGLKNGKYTIYGKHGEQEFKEMIDLPKEVDLDKVVETFKNNILGLVLPRNTKSAKKKRWEKKHERKT